MNRLGAYVQAEMDWRGWTLSDLTKAAGLDESDVMPILSREWLADWPSSQVVDAVARALQVPARELVLRAAEACGLSIAEKGPVASIADSSNEELMRELRRRLALGASAGNYLTTTSSPWLSLVAPRAQVG
jgi:lambda repressor-like predicted transcriptional regulator